MKLFYTATSPLKGGPEILNFMDEGILILGERRGGTREKERIKFMDEGILGERRRRDKGERKGMELRERAEFCLQADILNQKW